VSAVAVFAPRRFARLLAGDALSIARDPVLVFAIVMSLAPPVAFHFARTPLDAAAQASLGIVSGSRYLLPLALLIPAALIGWVTGFLLLEDRDEGTLLALDTTPVGKAGFLSYRLGITALAALLATLFAWPLVIPDAGAVKALLIAVLVAANAVLFAVVLPALARNKVEGLALTKLTNLLSLVPLLAAVPSPFRYLGGIVPAYWFGEILGLSAGWSLPPWIVAIAALVIHAAAIALLFRRFSRSAG
jgi:hypothetical protein